MPLDGRNTAWKMAERTLAVLGIAAEVTIHIEKRLPIQGGLGAGSANAAAALLGLERELGVTLSAEDRLRVAAEVGSDVPLFLVGGAVLGLGRGEDVSPLADFPASALRHRGPRDRRVHPCRFSGMGPAAFRIDPRRCSR